MPVPVYVINLPGSTERRERISGLLRGLSVKFEIVEAVDGRALSPKEIAEKVSLSWKYGTHVRNLLRGEIGCTLSHFMLYDKMIRENIEVACILEDDSEPDESFTSLISDGALSTSGWDLVFLGHHSICSKEPAAVVNRQKTGMSGSFIAEPVEIPVGSYGYMIRKKAAQEILIRGYPVRKPLDFYIGNASAIGISVKVISPPCVHHNYSLTSTIYNEKDLVFGNTLPESFRRMVRKTYKWFPWLRDIRILTAFYSNESVIFLRKAGLLNKNFARFKD